MTDHEKLKSLMWEYPKTFFNKNPIIIEAGAHKGEVCIDKFIKYYPEAEVHAFEPCLKSFNICKDRIETENLNQNIKIYNYGVSNENTKNILNISTSSNTNTLYSVNNSYSVTWPHSGEKEEVELITLNYWYQKLFKRIVTDIDMLYLNIEGHELEALKGATDILNKIKVIYLEVNFIEIWNACPTFGEIHSFMTQNGFYLSMHDKRKEYDWTSIQCSVVYVNNNTIF